MGVFYSSDKGSLEELRPRVENLRPKHIDARKLIDAYVIHQFQPAMESERLDMLFYAAYGRRMDSELTETLEFCRETFQDKSSIIYTQEVLVAIALLSDGTWNQRAGLLFNIFKCIGTEEMGHEDFMLAAQVVVASLCHLWHCEMWESSSLNILSEELADNAFTRLEKDLDENVGQVKFVQWAVDRFRESKTVASSEGLKALYTSAV